MQHLVLFANTSSSSNPVTNAVWVSSGVITIIGAIVFVLVGAYGFFKFRDGKSKKEQEIRDQAITDYQNALDAQSHRLKEMEIELKACSNKHAQTDQKLHEADNHIHKLEGQIEVFKNYPMDWQNSLKQITDFMAKTNEHMEKSNESLQVILEKLHHVK